MTSFSLCTAPLLALSFLPKPSSPVRNVRTAACSKERVLGAMYRLAREAEPATLQRLALVIGLAEVADLLAPLTRLASAGLVQKRGEVLSLSLPGFAAAAALSTGVRARRAGSAPVRGAGSRNPRRPA